MKLSIIMPIYNEPNLVIRALDSVPRQFDVEMIVVNDGSTDHTLKVLERYRDTNPDLNMTIISYDENKGIGYAKNLGFDNCTGEYIHQLDSDDYLIVAEYARAMRYLDGTDMVYINLEIDSGEVFRLSDATKEGYCGGACKFIRREFMGDTRCPEIRAGEDWYLNQKLLAKHPTETFTNITAYHYTYPREGSLYDQMIKGKKK